MVISTENKYVFIEIGKSGTTAISAELVNYYGGKKILKKHTSIKILLKLLKYKNLDYFIFASIRNPLNKVISTYEKLDTYWSSELIDAKKKNYLEKYYLKKKKKFKQSSTFENFFLRFYRFPYYDWALSEKRYCDFIIKQENIQNDFEIVIKKIGLKKVRDIPVQNKTKGKKNIDEYFISSKSRRRAEKIFTPYMNEFGYECPWEKELYKYPFYLNILFYLHSFFKRVYNYKIGRSNRIPKSQKISFRNEYKPLIANSLAIK